MRKFLSGKKTHSLGTGMIMLGNLKTIWPELPVDGKPSEKNSKTK